MTVTVFGDLFQFIRNGVSVKQDKSGDGLPISRIETISDGSVNPHRVGFAGLSADTAEGWILESGDILFSHINSVEHVGKCAVYRGLPDSLVHGMNLLNLRCDQSKCTPEFAKYLIRSPSFRNRLANFINKAVNQASVSIGNLRTIPVSVPSLPEQRHIAAILDQADALRAKRREALAQLDSLTQSIFIEMFGDPATNSLGWKLFGIGDLADVQGGLQVTTARRDLPLEVPYLRVANVYRRYLQLDEIKTIRATPAEVSRTTLKEGDLLVVEGHGNPKEIGRSALWDGSIPQCVHQNHLIRVRFDAGKVVPVYACEYLNSSGGRRHLVKAGKSTSGLNTISVSDVRVAPVALPPLALQQTFATRIQAVESLKTTHSAALAELDALFASLQHRAFAGQLS